MSARGFSAGLAMALLAACGNGGGSEVESTNVMPEGWEALRGAYSPDGERLAFLGKTADPSAIDQHLVVVEDGEVVDLTPERNLEGFGWMPDSRSLLVSIYDDDVESTTLAVVDLDGKLRPVPTTEPMLAVGGMAPLADGSRAVVAVQAPGAVTRYADLYEVVLASGAMRRLTSTEGIDEGEPAVVDDDHVAFNGGVLAVDAGAPNGWVGLLTLSTGEVRRLTSDDQTAGTPTVSPDGATIVYSAFPGNDRSQNALWAVPVGGGEPRLVAQRDAYDPAFLVDGSAVLAQVAGTGRLEIIPVPT